MDGLRLARVGATITQDATGWYVRPDTLGMRPGDAGRVMVRYVHRESLRPTSASSGRARARRFTRAGWTVVDSPPTALIVLAAMRRFGVSGGLAVTVRQSRAFVLFV
ncbi:hypothetical protein ACIPRL_35420 [Streptomyces sp. NPDC090085]|uniref:hypothetical protein n=1 Tax=Streptomyces sp. NPDC090085 TaxID=3365943 RepID=UPI00382AD5E2